MCKSTSISYQGTINSAFAIRINVSDPFSSSKPHRASIGATDVYSTQKQHKKMDIQVQGTTEEMEP